MKQTRIEPQPGQESVWDYPRPPRLEPTAKHLRVIYNSVIIADTTRAYRVLETSHPPVYYIPREDIQTHYLTETPQTSFCEFKGRAGYVRLRVGDRVAENAGWFYPNPTPAFAPIKDYIAFYASRVDACFVDDEAVQAQEGDFYGGWITQDIVGPFKGAAGTGGW